MSLTAEPTEVAVDATSLVVLVAEPYRAVYWGLTGNGSLDILDNMTDARGVAACKYVPDNNVDETVIVSATYGV